MNKLLEWLEEHQGEKIGMDELTFRTGVSARQVRTHLRKINDNMELGTVITIFDEGVYVYSRNHSQATIDKYMKHQRNQAISILVKCRNVRIKMNNKNQVSMLDDIIKSLGGA